MSRRGKITLLEKAKRVKRFKRYRKQAIGTSEEEIALAWSWLRGEITTKQAYLAVGGKKPQNAYNALSKIALALREMQRRGMLVRRNEEGFRVCTLADGKLVELSLVACEELRSRWQANFLQVFPANYNDLPASDESDKAFFDKHWLGDRSETFESFKEKTDG